MEVVVDGTRRWVPPEGITTFQALFEAFRKSQNDPRRVVALVKLDGAVLSGDRQAAMGQEALPSGGLLEIQTADRLALAAGTLADLHTHLAALERTHQEAAEQVIGANYRDALVRFKDCFEGWVLFVGALRSVSLAAEINLSTLETPDGPLEPVLRDLQSALSQFKTAFDQSDVVRLADLVQYDLKPLLGRARTGLEALRRKIPESGPPSR
jgi:hypothetical protein